MSIANSSPLERRPIHPGEILREGFMPDYDPNVSGLASALGVSRQSANELVRERRAVSPEMALRLAPLFGNSAEFWLNLQRSVDLFDAQATRGAELDRVDPLRVA
jgi:antitoxin HigA-1